MFPFLHGRGRGSCRRALWLALCAAACAPLAAQQQFIVTGAREAQPRAALAGDVVVVDRRQIEASSADSLEDLLRREAGLQLARSGGPGAASGVLIRGAFSGQTLVLVDGVRIGAATAGQAEFEAISLAQVERVEVLRGPASSLYGADAVGGVVQIFTRRADGTTAWRAQAGAGGLGARDAALSGQGAVGPLRWSAGVSHEQARGVSALRPGDLFGNHNPDADGFQRRNLQLALSAEPAPGQRLELRGLASRLNAQYDGSEFLPPSFAQDPSPDFRNRTSIHSAALVWRARWGEALTSQVQVADQASDARLGGRAIDRFRTDRRQADAQLSWTPRAGQQWTLALEDLHEDARSSAYLADAGRHNRAAVLAYAGESGGSALQAELRRDDNSVYGGNTTARLGGSQALGGGWRLRALAGTTFRAPSFNDLVFPGYGVPGLAPERGRSAEIGLAWQGAQGGLDATLFHNRVRGLIGYEPDATRCPRDPAYAFGCARNIGQARLQGLSLGGRWQRGAWTLNGQAEFLDATDRDTGQRLTRRAAQQQSLALRWRDGAWSAGAELLHVGDRPEGSARLPGYASVDLQAGWRAATGLRVEFRLNNAFDRDIVPARDYRAWPRQGWFGLRWSSS